MIILVQELYITLIELDELHIRKSVPFWKENRYLGSGKLACCTNDVISPTGEDFLLSIYSVKPMVEQFDVEGKPIEGYCPANLPS